MNLPTVVIHSRGDEEIPFELSRTFASARENIAFVETLPAPHGWEANVAPDEFDAAFKSWLG